MMSLRKIAKELGITPAYLSYMVNGKRPWRPELYERYTELVNSEGQSVNKPNPSRGGVGSITKRRFVGGSGRV